MNDRGDTVVAWTRRDDTNAQIVQARFRPAGGSFGAVQNLGTTQQCYTLGFLGPAPDTAVDSQGNAIVVWPTTSNGHTAVQAAFRPPDGTFADLGNISDDSQNVLGNPRVAMTRAGNAIAVWTRSSGTHNVVQASTRAPGGAFALPVNVSDSTHDASQTPSLAINDAGAVAVAWTLSDSPTFVAQARIKRAGGAFAAVQDVSATGPFPSSNVPSPDVAIDPVGRATLVWTHSNGTNFIVQSRSLTAAGAIGSDIDDVSDTGEDGDLPVVAVDATNTAVAVWRVCQVSTCTAAAASRPSNGSFGSGTTISPPGDSGFLLPRVAINPSGAALAAWTGDNDGIGTVVQVARRPAGGSFGAVETLSTTTDLVVFSGLAIDDEGNAVVGWQFMRQTTDRLTTATVAALDVAPPTLSNVSVPAGATTGQAVSMAVQAFDRWSGATTEWAFGDGAVATGGTVGHTYAAPGIYTVTITATDGASNTTQTSRAIQVTTPPPPPPPPGRSGIDADGDGFTAGQDCDDANPAIRPGALEIPGNDIDENCDGRAQPFPSIASPVSIGWRVAGARTTLLRLRLRQLPPGAAVQLRCSGRGCPFKRKSAGRPRRGALNALPAFGRRRTLRAGATLEIRITAPAMIGKVVRYSIRNGKQPKASTLCLPPGAPSAQRSC